MSWEQISNKSHGRLWVENQLLRRQLACYRRRGVRPVIGRWDRLLWILLVRIWPGMCWCLCAQVRCLVGTGPGFGHFGGIALEGEVVGASTANSDN